MPQLTSWIPQEGTAYSVSFVATFLVVAIWESIQPKRELQSSTEKRWANHGLLLAIGAVLSALLVRMSPMVIASSMADSPWGLLNKFWIPIPLQWLVAILLLDLVHYATHWGFHQVSFLWRIHEVHHSDADYDGRGGDSGSTRAGCACG
jgi:sterol desaturase/sphingolipid hydroxylase (fatty acid hydroxylase superfamily)